MGRSVNSYKVEQTYRHDTFPHKRKVV